jgi:hypothetical protein
MRRRALALVVVAACLGVVLVAADEIQVTTLVREGRVLVSFRLTNGFSEETLAAIHSGLPTSITYDVALRKGVPIWFDRTLASVTVTVSAQYDNLTRRHQLSRAIDGRVEEVRSEENEEAVRAWMTTFVRLPLFATASLEPNGEYYVRVEARTRPRTAWFFWPWDHGSTAGFARFTYIP